MVKVLPSLVTAPPTKAVAAGIPVPAASTALIFTLTLPVGRPTVLLTVHAKEKGLSVPNVLTSTLSVVTTTSPCAAAFAGPTIRKLPLEIPQLATVSFAYLSRIVKPGIT